ncbi:MULTISPECIES: DJ-1/PfpI family protein [unclassified Paenibacillus]|uniref:DJ-1/PfpI family protein n=1 Tax=unclassified Paenibacillus TaxID=185978 RepID=UPI0036413539
MKIQVVLFDGFDMLDVIAPFEVLGGASLLATGEAPVQFVSAEGKRKVNSGLYEVEFEATAQLDPNEAGIIVVPGGAGDMQGDGPGSIFAWLKQASESTLKPLMQQAMVNPAVIVATVCGGSTLLGMMGLMQGRHAVTHHLGMDALPSLGVIPVRARVVDDGNLVSSGGVTSGIDLAMYLAERTWGSRISTELESIFEHERRGTVWKKEQSIAG